MLEPLHQKSSRQIGIARPAVELPVSIEQWDDRLQIENRSLTNGYLMLSTHGEMLSRKLLLLAVAVAATGQTASRPEFEAASLKPNPSGREGYAIRVLPGGKLSATNINLKRLIAVAYSATDFQIFGNLNWLESQRFNMEAEAPGPAELNQLRVMLQSLLDDRFKLKIHRENRELPIYSLILAKNKGPGLVEAAYGDCGASVAPEAPASNGKPVSPIACGTVNPGPGRISGHRGRISQLADRLSTMLGRTVVDKTGLTGIYDIDLTWTPDATVAATELSGPSLFTAIQEQLGLKLEGGKGPVEVIVVDSAEKPSAN
jgi:uncharacterized protein (TIGR03435 family)